MTDHRSLERRLAAIVGRAKASPAVLRAIVERTTGALAQGLDVLECYVDRCDQQHATPTEAGRIFASMRGEFPPAVFQQGVELARFVAAAIDAEEGDELAVLGHSDDHGEDF